MTPEKALGLALPNIVVIGGIAIAVTIWLCHALSKPRNKRISILLDGFAFISIVVGAAITLGPNPEFHMSDGLRGRFTMSGSSWGVITGVLLAVFLHSIARNYATKDQ